MSRIARGAMLRGLLLATLALSIAPMAEAVTVDVQSSSAAGITILLAPGQYDVRFIGTAAGGGYNAWNAWGGSVSGCGSVAGACSTGWINALNITVGTGAPTIYYVGAPIPGPQIAAVFASDLESLAAHQAQFNPIVLSIAVPSPVTFWILDSDYVDNIGGVSVSVTPAVPEPGRLALLLAAVGAVALGSRHRRSNRGSTSPSRP